MVTVSLFRHAKSSWSDPKLGDFDRPLTKRGRKAAPRMGRYMAAKGIEPELILCSTALRARQTLELVLPFLPGKPVRHLVDWLYHASAGEMLAELRKLDGEIGHAMLVGHNPGLHVLALGLADDTRARGNLAAALETKYPTAGLAVLTFEADWPELAMGSGRLTDFTVPKRLPADIP